jgi:hypothetical protein
MAEEVSGYMPTKVARNVVQSKLVKPSTPFQNFLSFGEMYLKIASTF